MSSRPKSKTRHPKGPPPRDAYHQPRRSEGHPIEATPRDCDPVRATQFHTNNDGVFTNNWGDVLCFPYTLCIKFWECCTALCAGANYCMIYWMLLQWLMCKLQQITTPHPVVYPYFFNIFFQVFFLTFFFLALWGWYGKSTFIPYFRAYYTALLEVHYGPEAARKNLTRLSYRKYCFRKFEIFEVPVDNDNSGLAVLANYPLHYMTAALHYFVSKIIH